MNEALTEFAHKDPVKAQLAKLRFFAGQTMPQAAEILGISLATAERYWDIRTLSANLLSASRQ